MFPFVAIREFFTSSAAKYIFSALVIAGIAWKIDAHGYDTAKTKYEAEIATMKLSQSEALRTAEKKAKDSYDAQSKNMLRLSESLIAANQTIDAQTKALNERVHDVSTQYRPQPDAALQPVPGWIVPHGWVCDYNRAIGYTGIDAVPGAAAIVGGNASASCATDAFTPSGISGEQILGHHEEYGAYCRKLEVQVSKLLDDREFIERQQAQGNAGK